MWTAGSIKSGGKNIFILTFLIVWNDLGKIPADGWDELPISRTENKQIKVAPSLSKLGRFLSKDCKVNLSEV